MTRPIQPLAFFFSISPALLPARQAAAVQNPPAPPAANEDEIIKAAKRGDKAGLAQEIKKALDDGAPQRLNARGEDGKTALILAAQNGYVDCVNLLLANNADKDLTDNFGNSALINASIKIEHRDCAKALINAGADLNIAGTFEFEDSDKRTVRYAQVTALWVAAYRGNLEVLNALLAHGDQLETKKTDASGLNALMAAVLSKNKKAVEALIKANNTLPTEKRFSYVEPDNQGNTALHLASGLGKTDVYRTDIVELLIPVLSKDQLDIRNSRMETAAFLAAASGHANILKTLIDAGADINLPDRDGNTPLLIAAQMGYTPCVIELINTLDKEKGKDIPPEKKCQIDVQNKRGFTAVMAATVWKHEDAVREILKQHPNLSLQNKDLRNALDLAKQVHAKHILEMLVEESNPPLHRLIEQNDLKKFKEELAKHPEYLELTNIVGDTVLLDATVKGKADFIRAAIEAKANVEATNRYGEKALLLATRANHLPLVSALLTGKPDLNCRDEYQYTPLHLAAKQGQAAIAYALIAASGNAQEIIDARNEDNRTPLMLAAEFGHLDVLQALIQAKAAVNLAVSSWYRRELTGNIDEPHKRATSLENTKGIHALLLAAQNGHADCLVALLQAGADYTIKSEPLKWTALSRAKKFIQNECAEILKSRGAEE